MSLDNMYKSDPFCQIGQICDHRRHKYSLPKKSSGLRKLETFKIEKHARRMCIFAEAIWLPCFLDNCILVYSQDGVLLQTVQNFKIYRPHVLEEFSDTHLMVGAENGLFLLEDPPRGKAFTRIIENSAYLFTSCLYYPNLFHVSLNNCRESVNMGPDNWDSTGLVFTNILIF